jgi:hypothetical protein
VAVGVDGVAADDAVHDCDAAGLHPEVAV